MSDGRPPRKPLRSLGCIAYLESAIVAAGVVTTLAFFVVQYQTGSTQPFGSWSDFFGGLFSFVFIFLVLELRRTLALRAGPSAHAVFVAGLSAGVLVTIGSAVLLWGELGGPIPEGWGYLLGVGLALQSVGFLALIAWCLILGHLLKMAGSRRALWWGIVGATFVGLPFWFAWLGRAWSHGDPSRAASR